MQYTLLPISVRHWHFPIRKSPQESKLQAKKQATLLPPCFVTAIGSRRNLSNHAIKMLSLIAHKSGNVAATELLATNAKCGACQLIAPTGQPDLGVHLFHHTIPKHIKSLLSADCALICNSIHFQSTCMTIVLLVQEVDCLLTPLIQEASDADDGSNQQRAPFTPVQRCHHEVSSLRVRFNTELNVSEEIQSRGPRPRSTVLARCILQTPEPLDLHL